MQALRSHLALLLLLCLTRTLLPEAWILALHPHAHTTAEPAHTQAFARKGEALLSAKHQHCGVEQFYNVAFQPVVPIMVPAPRLAPRYAALLAPLAVRPLAAQPVGTRALRGPPRIA
ncbi:MAG: hypothetical protein JWR44_3247 [Hymenobacter sp.]|nr:hypothetical protein [Hymenobacter sp.]